MIKSTVKNGGARKETGTKPTFVRGRVADSGISDLLAPILFFIAYICDLQLLMISSLSWTFRQNLYRQRNSTSNHYMLYAISIKKYIFYADLQKITK